MYKKARNLMAVCFVLAVIFVILKNYFSIIENKLDKVIEILLEQEEIIEIDTTTSNEKTEEIFVTENENTDVLGKIMIPKIDLVAEIKEGTGKEIIDFYVGHFEDTSLNEGNIGLAAHNRGSNIKAYFANIKNLQENDIIIYQTKEIERNYFVKTIKIIKDTDFSYLEPTEDNRITLITCVQNAPNYRLCVQGVEKVAE